MQAGTSTMFLDSSLQNYDSHECVNVIKYLVLGILLEQQKKNVFIVKSRKFPFAPWSLTPRSPAS